MNSNQNNSYRYCIVSPVKDEERFIELTIKSVIKQTIRPLEWIIVDDGSVDRSAEIVRRYSNFNSFIRLFRNPDAGVRQTGSAVIQAFNFGLQFITHKNFDYIVKLDCDLSFESGYFHDLFKRFDEDFKIGIASGIYLELSQSGRWRPVQMPAYHAAGACKVIRRECFEQIEGFIAAAGWDTVDEIRAMRFGWRSAHFPDLRMKHHKREGSGIGLIRTSAMHGEIYYLTGGSRLFFIFKVIHRIGTEPYVSGALALLKGYLKAMRAGKRALVNEQEAQCYRALLNGRILGQAKRLLTRLGSLTCVWWP